MGVNKNLELELNRALGTAALNQALMEEELDISGARKHDSSKPRMDLLSHTAMMEIAKVLGFGSAKYDADNWRKGMEWRRLIGAAYRHLGAFQDGEDLDPESGLPHLAHLGCCVMFLLEMYKLEYGTDNRYVREREA